MPQRRRRGVGVCRRRARGRSVRVVRAQHDRAGLALRPSAPVKRGSSASPPALDTVGIVSAIVRSLASRYPSRCTAWRRRRAPRCSRTRPLTSASSPPLAAAGERVERSDDIVAVDTESSAKWLRVPTGDAHVGKSRSETITATMRLRAVAARHTDGSARWRSPSRTQRREVVAEVQLDRLDASARASRATSNRSGLPPPDSGCRTTPPLRRRRRGGVACDGEHPAAPPRARAPVPRGSTRPRARDPRARPLRRATTSTLAPTAAAYRGTSVTNPHHTSHNTTATPRHGRAPRESLYRDDHRPRRRRRRQRRDRADPRRITYHQRHTRRARRAAALPQVSRSETRTRLIRGGSPGPRQRKQQSSRRSPRSSQPVLAPVTVVGGGILTVAAVVAPSSRGSMTPAPPVGGLLNGL